MNWKKWICFMTMLGTFFLWGGLTPARAGEAELINLLKKKNIITQEEADELLLELRTTAQKEKSEIKKEVKAEIREDIKKDANKGEFMPKALQGFKYSAQLFTEWNAVNRFDGLPANATVPKNSNQFALNRGRFIMTKDINNWLGMNITADLFYNSNAGNENNGADLRLKAAYASMKFFGTETIVGMIPTPSDGYDSSIWPYRVQGKHFLDDAGILATDDLGIANQGTFGGCMDDDYLKFAAKPYSGKWGGYMIGLYNGSGYNSSAGDGNNNKIATALIYFRPLPTVPVLKGLQIAYFGAFGESNTRVAATNQYYNVQINMGQVSLLHNYFAIMGQYYWGKGTTTAADDKDRNGYLASTFVRVPYVEKLRVFGKVYNYDPDTNVNDNDYRIYVAGLSYDVSPELMPFIAWERRDNKRVNTAATANGSNIDYIKYQVGLQLKF